MYCINMMPKSKKLAAHEMCTSQKALHIILKPTIGWCQNHIIWQGIPSSNRIWKEGKFQSINAMLEFFVLFKVTNSR